LLSNLGVSWYIILLILILVLDSLFLWNGICVCR
jgi:hypothetical protein